MAHKLAVVREAGFSRFHGYERPLPELPAFWHCNQARCDPGYVLAHHAHRSVEIIYVISGSASWTVDGEPVALKGGDFFITRPGEVHGGVIGPRGLVNYAVGFDPKILPVPHASSPRRLATSRGDGDMVQAVSEACAADNHLSALDRRIIPGGHGCEAILSRLMHELDRCAADDERQRLLTVSMVQALLVELLVFVTRCSLRRNERQLPQRRSEAHDFSEILAWMATRVEHPPSLGETARRAGLSPAHFVVAFKRSTRQTPLEAMTLLRIEEAKRRLRARPRRAVTDIAIGLGFSSSQYFSLVFRKVVGCSPSQWQARSG
ncbi:MAG: AraC family transcriptional regulator [Planctomycetes bacterium]|nr:AraC family transcriptional regulator [Planctomycetota bacterium]